MKPVAAFRRRLRRFGKAPLCNGCAERAPRFGGFVFVLCYRCSGLVLGFAGGALVRQFAPGLPAIDPVLLAIALIALPLDALAQRHTRYRSTNTRRMVTGLAFGASLAQL